MGEPTNSYVRRVRVLVQFWCVNLERNTTTDGLYSAKTCMTDASRSGDQLKLQIDSMHGRRLRPRLGKFCSMLWDMLSVLWGHVFMGTQAE